MGRRGRGDCNMGGSGGLQEVTYAVPADKCGLVIGKGEENVSQFPVSVLRLCSQHTTEQSCIYYESSVRHTDIVSLIWLLFK